MTPHILYFTTTAQGNAAVYRTTHSIAHYCRSLLQQSARTAVLVLIAVQCNTVDFQVSDGSVCDWNSSAHRTAANIKSLWCPTDSRQGTGVSAQSVFL